MRKLLLLTGGILLLIFCNVAQAQMLTQTIRGSVVDIDSKSPLVGVTLYIEGSDPVVGTITDNHGNFKFMNLPVGRYTIVSNYMGYESKISPNLLLGSGKELVLDMQLAEEVTKLNEVVVKARKNKGEPLNEMALVSARSFTVEETQRYAGSLNDPSRMASSYAGVMGDPNGNNDIIIRGNSPKGLQWRIEGVPVPNPNHYANEGATGGPISIFNGSTLNNSDFFTGAFPAEYGNAYSGVFDINLRKGNNQKREYSLQAGLIGFDGTAEGPLFKNQQGSYLANFRYSSLAMLYNMGVKVAGDAIPKFYDFTLNTYVPTDNYGSFQLFAIGGSSTISFDEVDFKGWGGSNLTVVGLNHTYQMNPKTYVKSSLSYVATVSDWEEYDTQESLAEQLIWQSVYDYDTYRASTELTHKFSAKHTIKGGVSGSVVAFRFDVDQFQYAYNRMDKLLKD
ncbi:MAG: carboxypeptidase-like regulatory domain-containing protein, partial [Bacteroidales bacterium]|nr:carboxypeptidase-like regulatory domain-containing protein [Bacteroidales bacterium]